MLLPLSSHRREYTHKAIPACHFIHTKLIFCSQVARVTEFDRIFFMELSRATGSVLRIDLHFFFWAGRRDK